MARRHEYCDTEWHIPVSIGFNIIYYNSTLLEGTVNRKGIFCARYCPLLSIALAGGGL